MYLAYKFSKTNCKNRSEIFLLKNIKLEENDFYSSLKYLGETLICIIVGGGAFGSASNKYTLYMPIRVKISVCTERNSLRIFWSAEWSALQKFRSESDFPTPLRPFLERGSERAPTRRSALQTKPERYKHWSK